MLDKNNMSAPTSLTSTAATIGSGKEQYQNFKSSLSEMAGVGQQAKLFNRSRPESEMLIEAKFNELAKKILEELKQAQYSKEFFQAIDNIIKEPPTKTLVRPPPQQQTTSCRPEFANQQPQRASNHQRQPSFGEQQYQEPRSLPMEKQATPAKQMLVRHQQASPPSKQKSAIPVSNGAHNNIASPRKVAPENGTAYPIIKSATVDDATLRRHTSVRKSLITTSQESRKSSNVSSTQQSTRQLVKRRFMVNGDEDDEDEDDDDFDDFDDDDDDDDDDLNCDDYLRRRPSFQCRRQSHQQQQQATSLKTTQSNPISKSKTLSDATNLQSSDTNTTKSPSSNKQSTLKQPARQSPLYQHQPSTIQQGTSVAGNKSQLKSSASGSHQRYNPITRSNTVTAANGSARAAASSVAPSRYNNQERELYSRHSPSEPKSMILNSKDIRSLYKPHMNYSTSVLGNHRLSDDDEIIIIPTQSPSIMSTSPDGEANQDELTERFSISRTKSFWEKLSKGSGGRRSNGAESNSGESNNGCIIHNGSNKVGRTNNNNTQSYSLTSASGNKASANMNGHSHTLDRMDSTGGSNSNYNESSSGDENGACYSSQQNPTLRELEEMSRQNRLRQTK